MYKIVRTTLLLLLFVSLTNSYAQKALFVNDNDYLLYNTDTVLSAITAAGIQHDVFDTHDSLRSPTAAEMQPYDVVIWYCSSDGVGGYIWNGDDSDNQELIMYLENGGTLWLIGTDVLFDRYGSAPDPFLPGDFVYDYLGIAQYDVQSYGDDGSLGVSELIPGGYMAPFVDTIRWIYPTAWWVDGCTPVDARYSLFVMGPDDYVLNGYASAIFNRNSLWEDTKSVTFCFDPAIVDYFANRVKLMADTWKIINMPPPPAIKKHDKIAGNFIKGANPVTEALTCSIPEHLASQNVSFSVTSSSGKVVYSQKVGSGNEIEINVSSWQSGIYYAIFANDETIVSQKFIKVSR